MFQYITNEQLNGFDSYKYSCKDTSPLSNWVMHPFWNSFVKLYPRWVAPNLLTLLGFLFLISQTILLKWFKLQNSHVSCRPKHVLPRPKLFQPKAVVDPNMDQGGSLNALPSWVWYYSAFALFMAHTLDGTDGKQARRTGSSSPLGEMFDHGLDSWSTSLFAINFYSVLGNDLNGGLSNDERYSLTWLLCINFLCSHWEKYNTGIMYLPWAYDFSMLTNFIVYILSGIYGTGIWTSPLLAGYTFVDILKVTMYGGSVFTMIVAVKNVIDVWRANTCKQPNLIESFRPWVPLLLNIFVITLWLYKLTPYDILGRKTRMILILSGVVFANIACRLIVVQMSSTRAEIFNPLTLPVLAGAALDGIVQKPYIAPTIWLIVTIVCLIMHIHYGMGVVAGLANYLNIRVFKITPIKTN